MNGLTLSRYDMEPDIIIPETDFFTLAIENKEFLLGILAELRNQTENGKDGSFHLSLNGKGMDVGKSIAAIFDFTDIDFNSKPITNLLVKKFTEFLGTAEQAEPLTRLEDTILNLVEEFQIKSGLTVECDAAMNGSNFAKACALRIADGGQSLLERLCEYVNLLCDLKPLKLFVPVFGKAFLTRDDIDALYGHCADKNVRLLFIEGTDHAERLANERRLIIDADLCPIPQGYS